MQSNAWLLWMPVHGAGLMNATSSTAHRTRSSAGSTDDLVVAALVVATVMPLMLLALAARIWWLHTHYPELLLPTKERKRRQKQRNKMRHQVAFKIEPCPLLHPCAVMILILRSGFVAATCL
jgi:hypothetical protein